jgi:hypothetical protein
MINGAPGRTTSFVRSGGILVRTADHEVVRSRLPSYRNSDQGLGSSLVECHVVAATDLEDVIDEDFEGWPVGGLEVALLNHAVEAGEHGGDQAGKLGDEARRRPDGVLLRDAASANPILTGGRRLCSSSLVAAMPR